MFQNLTKGHRELSCIVEKLDVVVTLAYSGDYEAKAKAIDALVDAIMDFTETYKDLSDDCFNQLKDSLEGGQN